MEVILTFIQRAIMQGIPILFGASGEILTEKSGNLNLGIPGIMYMGGVSGLIAAFLYERAAGESAVGSVGLVLSLLFAILVAMLGGLIYSVLTITLRANQNVTGLALTIFGAGMANFFGVLVLNGGTSVKASFAHEVFTKPIPYLSNHLGWFGKMFFSYGFMVYLAVLVAAVLNYFIYRTRTGLNLRAVGENPATADAAGINVTRYKYLATCLGAGITGLGGVYYVMDYGYATWSTANSIQALGWLAVALVIFATWKPKNIIWGAYVFGIFYWLYNYLPKMLGFKLPNYAVQLIQTVPYIVTILVLIYVSRHNNRESRGPAALGLSYFREDR